MIDIDVDALRGMSLDQTLQLAEMLGTVNPALAGLAPDLQKLTKMRAAGNIAGCRRLAEKYRPIAAAHGLGEVFDSLFTEL